MGRPRKIKSVEEMTRLWAAYKAYCDTQSVLTHRLDYKSGEFISKELKRPFTYTIQGFCAFIGLARSNFYATYGKDKSEGVLLQAYVDNAGNVSVAVNGVVKLRVMWLRLRANSFARRCSAATRDAFTKTFP